MNARLCASYVENMDKLGEYLITAYLHNWNREIHPDLKKT